MSHDPDMKYIQSATKGHR